MRQIHTIFWFLLILFSGCIHKDVTVYVDPNIGGVATLLTTKNPTVHRPHSMVRVFPVTKPGLNDRFLSDKIYGFALNMPAYRMGHVTEIMPTAGKLNISRNENAALYDHDQEEVHPYYHKVWLEDSKIEADWTTTERAVIYRFNYKGKDSGNILFRSEGKASFKKYTGLSPNQYHLSLRIQHAIYLLNNTDLSIKEISFNLGFCSIFYFSKVFKEKTRQNPSCYRQKRKE